MEYEFYVIQAIKPAFVFGEYIKPDGYHTNQIIDAERFGDFEQAEISRKNRFKRYPEYYEAVKVKCKCEVVK